MDGNRWYKWSDKRESKNSLETTVLVLFDCDEAGKKGADKACQVLSQHRRIPSKS